MQSVVRHNGISQTMLAQYLVLLGATNSQKSKSKSGMRVNSPQVNKKRTIHFHLLIESFSKNANFRLVFLYNCS